MACGQVPATRTVVLVCCICKFNLASYEASYKGCTYFNSTLTGGPLKHLNFIQVSDYNKYVSLIFHDTSPCKY